VRGTRRLRGLPLAPMPSSGPGYVSQVRSGTFRGWLRTLPLPLLSSTSSEINASPLRSRQARGQLLIQDKGKYHISQSITAYSLAVSLICGCLVVVHSSIFKLVYTVCLASNYVLSLLRDKQSYIACCKAPTHNSQPLNANEVPRKNIIISGI